MKTTALHKLTLTALIALCATTFTPRALAQDADATPGFNHKIPEKIMTPDKVETPIGTMNFSDGMPDPATVQKCYDNLDLIRGEEAFLNGIPAASLEALRMWHVESGAGASNQAIIMDQLLDSGAVMLTGNTDTVYCSVMLDLQKDGPTVVEIPSACGPGTVRRRVFPLRRRQEASHPPKTHNPTPSCHPGETPYTSRFATFYGMLEIGS
jgi:hypothetical protein